MVHQHVHNVPRVCPCLGSRQPSLPTGLLLELGVSRSTSEPQSPWLNSPNADHRRSTTPDFETHKSNAILHPQTQGLLGHGPRGWPPSVTGIMEYMQFLWRWRLLAFMARILEVPLRGAGVATLQCPNHESASWDVNASKASRRRAPWVGILNGRFINFDSLNDKLVDHTRYNWEWQMMNFSTWHACVELNEAVFS